MQVVLIGGVSLSGQGRNAACREQEHVLSIIFEVGVVSYLNAEVRWP